MVRLRKTAMFMLLLVTIFSCSYVASAQGFDDDIDDMSDMPLDGGITLVAAGGFAYMMKKMAAKKKDK